MQRNTKSMGLWPIGQMVWLDEVANWLWHPNKATIQRYNRVSNSALDQLLPRELTSSELGRAVR